MRIAIDFREYCGYRAGKRKYTLEIVKNLVKQGRRHRFILYTQNKFLASRPAGHRYAQVLTGRPNIEVRNLCVPRVFWHFFVWLDLLLVTKPDAYLAPTSYIIPALGVPHTTMIVPDLVSFFFPRSHQRKAVWLERIFLKWALKKAEKIVAISQSTKRDLVRLFSIAPGRIEVVYLAADPSFRRYIGQDPRLEATRAKYGLPRQFSFYVGTIEPRKNLSRLLQAWQKPPLARYSLVLAGGRGWQWEALDAQAQPLQRTGKVRFLGHIPQADLPSLYNLATFFIFPSLYEGFGLPPLEAMACGTPVLTSKSSSLPEVVGQAALLVNPKKVAEIYHAALRLFRDPDLRITLSARGQAQAQKFSWPKTAQTILKILEAGALYD